MTEQELINSMVALTVNATAVLQAIQTYGTINQDVTITLSGGASVTLPSMPKQVAAFNAAITAQQLAMAKDFAGAVAGVAITRDAATGRIATATATLSTGWTITQTLTRNVAGKVSQIVVLVKDALGNVLNTATRTVNYDASNRFLSVS